MDDNFSVAVGVTGAALFEPFAQFLEVVDLAIEDDPYSLVFVVHRLLPRQDNDAQAAHAQADRPRREHFSSGPAMDDRRTSAHGGGVTISSGGQPGGYPGNCSTAQPVFRANSGLEAQSHERRLARFATWRFSRPQLSNQRNTSS